MSSQVISTRNAAESNGQETRLGKVGMIGAYGIGQVGIQLSWYMMNSYLMLFYTDVVGLAASAISLIMLISQVWEAVANPAIGLITDRTHSRWGRFRPYLMFTPPFLAVFNVLTFTVVPVQGAAKVVWCFVTYICVGTAATVIGLAAAGLINTLSSNSRMRNFLVASKAVGGSLGKVIISAVAMPLVLFFGNGKKVSASGYFWTAVVFSVLLIPCIWICAKFCKEPSKIHMEMRKVPRIPVKNSLKLLFQNKQLMFAVLTIFVMMIAIAGRTSLFSYYIIYVAGNVHWVAPAMTTLAAMQLLSSFLIPAGAKALGKRNLMVALNLVQIGSLILMFLLPANNIVLFMGLTAVIGFCNSSSSISPGMVADSIDYGYWKSGHREAGLGTSISIFATKLASAVFQTVGILMLAGVGYVAGAQQTPTTIRGISAVVNIVPAVLLALSLIPLFCYKLDDKTMEKINKEIDERELEKEGQ